MGNKLILLLLIATNTFAQLDTLEKKSKIDYYTLNELREQLEDSFNDPALSNAFCGAFVRSLKTGEVIYKKNADKLFIPASNIKLFTTVAALILLGPDYVYETNLFANGTIKNGVLQGDLIIQGTGDPTISNRYYPGSEVKIFEDWADSLLAKGILKIDGDIIGDDSGFENGGLGKGWLIDNESYWFSAPSGALCFNDNSIEIIVKPGQQNFPASVELNPNTQYVNIIGGVITVDNSEEQLIKCNRLRGTNLISVTGKIKKNSKPIIENISISNPTMYFLTVFKEVLERKGIIVTGKLTSIGNSERMIIYQNLIPLLTHQSVPLKTIIKELNKNSNNFYAEQILKTIGYEIYGYGTTENGIKASKDLFKQIGIDPDNLVMVDGSGLSQLNLITPRQVVNLLSYIYKSNIFNYIYDSLPIAGVDGTLSQRMNKTTCENNVRAKPGFNLNSSALSGYVKTISGELLAFSIMINNFLAPPSLINYIQDNICNKLSNFVRN
ncbi:D-alanyl-D-alanine carboxypeptidase/D-alanyl-D-alanine endopeptidase [Rosettibacter firmus]|uniref:D-alanyl-D-alanine carboxypeptidase/D-alanyl-D-alanine endopeptidase n=1 Tax=Rosettibacter firmus TaxID=3111522 RepID=UPI00336BF5BD